MFMILTVLLTIVVSFIVWIYERKKKFSSLDSLPGPQPLPVLGSALEFGLNPVDQLKDLVRLSNAYSPTLKIWIGPKDVYCITTDPDLMEFILGSPKYIKKSTDYNIFKAWLNNGLLLANGSYWQKRRKILTPAFHFKILDGFTSTFNKQSAIFIKNLSKKVDQDEFDVYPFVTALTLDVICETAMGTTVNAQNTTDNEYVKAVKTVCNIAINRFFSPWKKFDTLFRFSFDYQTQNKCLKILHGFTRSVIEKRRKMLEENTTQAVTDDDVGMKKKQVFMDILLNVSVDGKKLSDADIQEEVDTFMFEGHDTTASLIAFAIYELSRNSDVQDKLFAEVRAIYHDNKNYEPTLQDLNELKYTELVLKETMRLYPSVPFIARSLDENINFKGTTYPKDTVLFLFTYGMHRREDIFPNATKFNPERFASTGLTNPFAFVPFSAGPRNCIGQKFAMYETKCTISKIIMNYELLPAKDRELVLASEIILKSVTGVPVKLRDRKIK